MYGGNAVHRNLLCLSYADVRGRIFLVDLEEKRPVAFWEYGGAGDAESMSEMQEMQEMQDMQGMQGMHYADAGGVAMDAHCGIYVADTRNDQVRHFTPFGKELAALGEKRAGN